MARLKQIKKADLGEFGKDVVDSLINKKKLSRDDNEHEQMRVKVDILEGYTKHRLIDSFIVNTTNLHKTIQSIEEKYGNYVQFKITNLYDEKIVVTSLFEISGSNKEKEDKEHFNTQMDLVKKIHKFKSEGKTLEDVIPKVSYLAGKTYIIRVYNSTEEEMKQFWRDSYNNQTLGRNSEVITKDLNTKENIVDIKLLGET